MKIAVTGANGFVGAEVCRVLQDRKFEVARLERTPVKANYLNELGQLRNSLAGAQAVIHLAARAHIIKDRAQDPLSEFRRINVQGTMNVAIAAAEIGVSRVVYVSSIGVLGNSSDKNGFSEKDTPSPIGPYAVSKLEAEETLIDIASRARLETVIVRPPLVYGSRVRGNFLRLLKLIGTGVPLPFGSVKNQRSFIGLTNLAGLLVQCATDSRAAGQMFVVSDGEDVSLRELLRSMSHAMDLPSRLISFPAPLLKAAFVILRRAEEFEKLAGTLRVDSRKVRNVLAWTPTKSLSAGIKDMVAWYLSQAN